MPTQLVHVQECTADTAEARVEDLVTEEVGCEREERAGRSHDGSSRDELGFALGDRADDRANDGKNAAEDRRRPATKVIAAEGEKWEQDEGRQVRNRGDDSEAVPGGRVEVGIPGVERLQSVHVRAIFIAEGESLSASVQKRTRARKWAKRTVSDDEGAQPAGHGDAEVTTQRAIAPP